MAGASRAKSKELARDADKRWPRSIVPTGHKAEDQVQLTEWRSFRKERLAPWKYLAESLLANKLATGGRW
jgi:hypothetical protein